jgi:peroxiredoxin
MQQQYTALLRASSVLRSSQPAFTSRLFASSAASQPQQAQNYDSYSVPAGHQNSDLGSIACNISLNRRRDLTLREDLKVFADGKETTLAALMRGKLVALFGVPDMGKVCSDTHLPDFLKNADKLKKAGIKQIACAAVAPASQLEEWAKKNGNANSHIALIADEAGGMTRMLGLDIPAKTGDKSAAGPRSQRYAALVDGGILLKLKVEANIAEVKESSAESILDMMKTLKC